MPREGKTTLTISLFGVSIPLPRWTLPVFGVIACAGLAGVVWHNVVPAPQAAVPDLITLKQANAQLEQEITEYGLHMNDVAESKYEAQDGSFTLETYADRCVLIQRRVSGKVLTKLVMDLSRLAASPAPVARIGHHLLDALVPTVEAQGRCVTGAHGGPFTTAYGARNGCMMQVWRTFTDGCVHYQWFNTCNGYWDSNPDGTPRVTWTRCVH